MTSKLPPPSDIAGHYNRLMKHLDGQYMYQRWGDSEIKRRHYRQTELGIQFGLTHVSHLGDVLEIGSGPAVWTTLYLKNARTAVLLDISEEMLAQARTTLSNWNEGLYVGKARYVCGDFLEVVQKNESYDTIISSRAFEYMSDKPAFVRKCFTLLRPGGTLLLVTKNHDWRDLRKTRHNIEHVPRDQIPVALAMQLDLASPSSVGEMASAAGFSAVDLYPVVLGSYHPPFDWGPGLVILDALHRLYYRRPMSLIPAPLRSLTESFLAVAWKAE
ncbi:MAG: class I SAM-dependent methyltransferase [Gemmatimonadota bacterium]|nr:class I SAM-dependent methyltransferase [Gemmatimonadota bacterium]